MSGKYGHGDYRWDCSDPTGYRCRDCGGILYRKDSGDDFTYVCENCLHQCEKCSDGCNTVGFAKPEDVPYLCLFCDTPVKPIIGEASATCNSQRTNK